MEIIIREYRSSDLTALIQLFRDSIRSIARRDYSERQVLAWAPDFIDSEVFGRRRAERPTWIAEIHGMIVGFLDLEPDGHIDMLYVHAEHQARGVARALLVHIENVAIRLGLDRLYTEASITARTAFEHRGFVVVATQTALLRGETFTNYRMEKQIASTGKTQ
jgi:putative acetyltransferase